MDNTFDGTFTLPLAIRDVAPGPGFTQITGVRPDGLPNGVHTGGAWLSPDGREIWKPLDGRPYANSTVHIPTKEAQCLEVMAGEPAFPHNWRVEEAGAVTVDGDGATYTRWWLVREKAWLVPQDYPAEEMSLEHVLEVERGLRRLNERGWEINDALQVAFDPQGRVFIVDLSVAWPYARPDDEEWFLRWAEAMGYQRLVDLRRNGSRVCSLARICTGDDRDWPRDTDGRVDLSYRHIYASCNRPISSLWATIPGAHFKDADYAKTRVWTWVATRALLDDETVRRYELIWAWSPPPMARRDAGEITHGEIYVSTRKKEVKSDDCGWQIGSKSDTGT